MGKGKRLPTRKLTLEPYYNLPPDLKDCERHSGRRLSFPEHMCGILNMARKAMDLDTDAYAVITHAAQVAQDATTLHWPEVRNWSQTCPAHIEAGPAKWTIKLIFHKERTPLSWIRGKTQDQFKVPCLDFNEEKCQEYREHIAKGKTYLHTCVVCFYGMDLKVTNHAAPKCCKKPGLKLLQDDGHVDYRKRPNPPRLASTTTSHKSKN